MDVRKLEERIVKLYEKGANDDKTSDEIESLIRCEVGGYEREDETGAYRYA